MITRFNDKYNLDKEFTAEIVQDVEYKDDNTIVKLHIPTLLPTVVRGGAKARKIFLPHKKVFVNDEDTYPNIKRTYITEKNYLNAKIDKNSNLDSISNVDVAYTFTHISTELSLFDENIAYIPEVDNNISDKDEDFSSTEFTPEHTNLLVNQDNLEPISSILNDSGSITILDVDSNEEIFNSKNDKDKSFFIESPSEIIFKTEEGSNIMTTKITNERKKYDIKRGSKVLCIFLNSNLSKLYMNTSNS